MFLVLHGSGRFGSTRRQTSPRLHVVSASPSPTRLEARSARDRRRMLWDRGTGAGGGPPPHPPRSPPSGPSASPPGAPAKANRTIYETEPTYPSITSSGGPKIIPHPRAPAGSLPVLAPDDPRTGVLKLPVFRSRLRVARSVSRRYAALTAAYARSYIERLCTLVQTRRYTPHAPSRHGLHLNTLQLSVPYYRSYTL